MAKVTIFVDPTGASGAGHAFIALTDINGYTHYYGYYSSTNPFYSDGIIKDEALIEDPAEQDTNHNQIADRVEGSIAIATETISDEQYARMNDYVQDRIENPGKYLILPNESTDNCATFVRDVLGAGGVANGFGSIPNGFPQDKTLNDWNRMTPEQQAMALANGFGPEAFQRSNGFPPGYDPESGKGYSPLVLDLDGNGIHTTAITLSRTFYDLDNDGMAELVGWSDGKDGFLAYDRNGDGVIENGSELFGDHTYLTDGSYAPNGFEALAEYDGDANGMIDAQDAIYDDLRVWIDANRDGISQTAEMHTLAELQISSISVEYQNINVEENGTRHLQASTFVIKGKTKKITSAAA